MVFFRRRFKGGGKKFRRPSYRRKGSYKRSFGFKKHNSFRRSSYKRPLYRGKSVGKYVIKSLVGEQERRERFKASHIKMWNLKGGYKKWMPIWQAKDVLAQDGAGQLWTVYKDLNAQGNDYLARDLGALPRPVNRTQQLYNRLF